MRILYTAFCLVLSLSLVSCASDGAEKAADVAPPTTETPQVNQVADSGASTPAPAAAPTPAPAAARPVAAPRDTTPAAPPAPRTIQVPAGTPVEIIFIDSLSSATSKAGDQFAATLGAPIMVNGQPVVERGTRVQGRVVDAEGSGRVSGRASMRLVLTNLVIAGKTVPLVTETLVSEAEGTQGRDAAVVGGAAGIGAAIGAIAGGKGGAGKGALIGTAAGAGTVLATRGKEVEFPSESRLTFKLGQTADVPRS